MWWISAQLYIRSVWPGLQSSLSNLQRITLGSDGLLQWLDVLLLVVDLLHGLAEVGLQLVVGVGGLGDPLLEGHVGVVPVGPHLIRALSDQIINLSSQPLTGRSGSWNQSLRVICKQCGRKVFTFQCSRHTLLKQSNKILLTLWRLDVSVAEVRPCLRDADVRIHLLNATVEIDGSAGVLQVVTRVVDVDAVVLVSQVSLYLVPSVPELWLVRSINTDLWLVNITCSLLADGWPAPESSSSCPGMTWCCPPPSSDCSPHHRWPGQYPSSPLYTQRLVNNHQQSWLTCCKYTQRWLSWVPQSQPELSQDSSSWSPGDESHWHSSPTQTAALRLVSYYLYWALIGQSPDLQNVSSCSLSPILLSLSLWVSVVLSSLSLINLTASFLILSLLFLLESALL